MEKTSSDPRSWEVLDRREIFAAPPFLRLTMDRVRLPDGKVVEDYYHLEKPDYVLVVPFLADGRILLVRQYKQGVGRIGLYPPGGHVARGESPLTAVQRELLEETGYTAGRWRSLGSYVADANQGCGSAHLFVAEEARPVAAARSGDLEEMEIVRLTPDELQAALSAGEINALGSIAALALALNSRPAS